MNGHFEAGFQLRFCPVRCQAFRQLDLSLLRDGFKSKIT